MKKFEYMQIVFDEQFSHSLCEEMNTFGKGGWEAYAIIPQVLGNKIQVFFKREIHE